METGVRVRLLGRASALTGDASVDFVPNRRFQLLAYLAYQGDWVARDKLAFLFWPDEPDHTARHNLRQLLKYVRKMAWLAGLVADEHRVRWSVRTDVASFMEALDGGRLDETLPLYGGPLLVGLEGDGEGEFGEWLALERKELHGRWRAALLAKADELAGTEERAQAAALLRRLLERDPLDEEGLQAYMQAAAGAGQRQQALAAYRSFAKRLGAELGMEPTSTTEGLARAVEQLPPEPLPPRKVPASAADHTAAVAVPERSASPLPKAATSFVGRDNELAEIADLLSREECRLLTLTGAGGVGKTRLALQAAQRLSRNYPGGSAFVALDALTSASLIPESVATALELELRGGEEPVFQVVRFLGDKRLLLVLDNYEHLLEGATVASELARGCPGLKLLVTSRGRLGLEEEWLLPVEGLSHPEGDVPVGQAAAYDAVRLFVGRARQVRPGYALTERDLPHLLKVCRTVGGAPLGIELAAAWVRAIPVEEIAREIENGFDLLGSASRNVAARHSSVRACFEYSWGLLAPKEREVLRKLSVFRGGFRREAAAFVADAGVALLAGLVDKSLLRLSQNGRYGFHPLLLPYVTEKLAEHPAEHAEVREKHGRFYHAFLQSKEGKASQKGDLSDVATEFENVRGALLSNTKIRPQDFHRSLEAVLQYLDLTGRHREAAELLARAAAPLDEREPAHRSAVGSILVNQAFCFYRLDEQSTSRRLAERGLQLTSWPRDCIPVILGRHTVAALAHDSGDYAKAVRERRELDQLIREVTENEHLPPHLAYRALAANLDAYGNAEKRLRNYEAARDLYEQSIAVNKRIGHDAHAALGLCHLSETLVLMNDPTAALPVAKESSTLASNLGFRPLVRDSLEALMGTYAALGDSLSAQRVVREASEVSSGEGELSDLEREALAALVGSLPHSPASRPH